MNAPPPMVCAACGLDVSARSSVASSGRRLCIQCGTKEGVLEAPKVCAFCDMLRALVRPHADPVEAIEVGFVAGAVMGPQYHLHAKEGVLVLCPRHGAMFGAGLRKAGLEVEFVGVEAPPATTGPATNAKGGAS